MIRLCIDLASFNRFITSQLVLDAFWYPLLGELKILLTVFRQVMEELVDQPQVHLRQMLLGLVAIHQLHQSLYIGEVSGLHKLYS